VEYITKMRRIIIITFLLILVFSHIECTCQTLDSIELQVKQIREEYDRINSNTKLRSVQENINEASEEGGTLKKFYDSTILLKATLVFYGETGKTTSEYYFQKGALIFVYEREDRYEAPIYKKKDVKIKSINQNRYYFGNEGLIRWLGNDNKIVDIKLYSSKEEEISEDLKNYILK